MEESGCGILTPHAGHTVLQKSPGSRGQFLKLQRTLCDSFLPGLIQISLSLEKTIDTPPNTGGHLCILPRIIRGQWEGGIRAGSHGQTCQKWLLELPWSAFSLHPLPQGPSGGLSPRPAFLFLILTTDLSQLLRSPKYIWAECHYLHALLSGR